MLSARARTAGGAIASAPRAAFAISSRRSPGTASTRRHCLPACPAAAWSGCCLVSCSSSRATRGHWPASRCPRLGGTRRSRSAQRRVTATPRSSATANSYRQRARRHWSSPPTASCVDGWRPASRSKARRGCCRDWTRISTSTRDAVVAARYRTRSAVGHHERMRLDHLSYAAGPEGLAACVQRLGARLGAAFTDGGIHPSFGTRNFVLGLNNGCYLEVVDVLDHPAVDSAPFGIAVKARGQAGGGWLGWAVRVHDITAIESRLGRRAVDGHRRRPDGFDLRWKQIGIKDLAVDPQRPFFVQWQTDDAHHPSGNGSAITLTSLELAGDDDDETGLVAAVFNTPNGAVRLD